MPDWNCPEAAYYGLQSKVNERNTQNRNFSFFGRIFDNFNSTDIREQLYQTACLRLLCQYLHENLQDDLGGDSGNIIHDLLTETLSVNKPELKAKLFDIILSVSIVLAQKGRLVAHVEEIKTNIKVLGEIDEHKKFKTMAYQLKKQQLEEFHDNFEAFSRTSDEYSHAPVAHHVRLLVFIATNLRLALTVDDITRKFPFVGNHVSILTTLNELRMFNNFKIIKFKGKLKQLVST